MHSGEFIEGLSRTKYVPTQRFGILLLLLLAGIAVLWGRSFYLQVMHGRTYRAAAEENRVTPQLLPAPRGIIYDAEGRQLVENISSTDLILDPTLLPSREDEGYLLENLPALVPSLPIDDVRAALDRTRSIQRPVLLVKALEHETVLAIEQVQESIQGARLVSSLVRKYPYGPAGAHVLGYTSPVTPEELAQDSDLTPTDTTGKSGVEGVYDTRLRGTHGVAYTEVNASGRPLLDLGKQDPQPGEDLRLTLDIELQKYIMSVFADRDAEAQATGHQNLSGAAVVMDPDTGAVLGLVSYPSFDPNAFSQPAQRTRTTSMFTDERQPLFNRATEGTYPSGSTIKPFLAAGGLQEGVITANTTVLSTGGITVGPWHFADWKAGGHGTTDVRKAIAESVNTFFYLLSGGDESRRGLGVVKIGEYLKDFGWASPTGVDLPSEAAGFIPTPEWKEATFHERWYIGDTYHLGIGQGSVLVTPLQIANATAAIANGQYLYTPHFIQMNKPKRRLIGIDRSNITVVQEGMRQTVISGSARSLNNLSLPLAGKTGTAQIGGSENTHAWFTSFGPYEKPAFVVTVLLEEGGAGDEAAVPIARDIWQWLIDHPED